MKQLVYGSLFFSFFATSTSFAAGIDALAPSATKPAPKATPKPEGESTDQASSEIEQPDTIPPVALPPGAPGAPGAPETQNPEQPPVIRSALSKKLDGRLSLGTSVGWGIVKPSKGTWIGIGAADLSFQYRNSAKPDGKLYFTGRYAPFAGVWTVDRRDYDTTLHGLYGGAEFHLPGTPLPSTTLKAGVELGYMIVYAKPQDHAEASSAVKGGKVNLAAGGGMDWSILDNKIKVGPFARLHLIGFTIFNVGASARFVF